MDEKALIDPLWTTDVLKKCVELRFEGWTLKQINKEIARLFGWNRIATNKELWSMTEKDTRFKYNMERAAKVCAALSIDKQLEIANKIEEELIDTSRGKAVADIHDRVAQRLDPKKYSSHQTIEADVKTSVQDVKAALRRAKDMRASGKPGTGE